MDTTPRPAIDFSQLLGFDGLSPAANDAVDFRDAEVSARLGAKVGMPEPTLRPDDERT